jgi:hypothetical protein
VRIWDVLGWGVVVRRESKEMPEEGNKIVGKLSRQQQI